ncbi:hypothetical protein [Polaromonas sp. CG9_12]|nr:hypothetical protein [Polaromonas sp. CG9_12]
MSAAIEATILAALQELGRATLRQVEDHSAVAKARDGCPVCVRYALDSMRRAGKIAHDHSRYPPSGWCWPGIY